MTNKVQLFINGDPVDLYGNESIDVNRLLRDFQDISAVIGEFSSEFKIPASPKNNKIFSHWWNPDIYGGFNANVAVESYLLLNGAVEFSGVIEMTDCEIKDRRPEFYTVQFFGDKMSLASEFGTDLLPDVPMSAYDHELTYTNVKDSWAGALFGGSVLYPIICFERPWQFAKNPSNANVLEAINRSDTAIDVGELRPAYRLRDYVQSIFSNYGLSVSGRFFTDSFTEDLYILPMREAGYYNNQQERNKALTSRNLVSQVYNYSLNATTLINIGTAIYDPNSDWNSAGDTWTAPFTGEFTVQFNFPGNGVISTPDLFLYIQNVTAGTQLQYLGVFTVLTFNAFSCIVKFKATINSQYQFFAKFYSITLPGSYTGGGTVKVMSFEGGQGGQTVLHPIVAPEIKVNDFISGLMSSMNLVLNPTGPKEWDLDFFEDWLTDGNIRDFDQFVNRERIRPEKPPTFKYLSMKYADSDDIQNVFFERLTGRDFGGMDYRPPGDFATEELKVESIFTLLPPNRIRRAEDSTFTDLEIPFMLDDGGDKVKADFLIFYYAGEQGVTNQYGLKDEAGTTTFQATFPFCRFNQSRPGVTDDFSLGYSLEQTPEGATPIKTLFQEKFQSLIERFYNSNTRSVEFEARIPLNLWMILKANDTITFDGRYYKLESVGYNYTTEIARCRAITFEPDSIGKVTTIDPGGDLGFDIPVGVAQILRLNASPIAGGAIVPISSSVSIPAIQQATLSSYTHKAITENGSALRITSSKVILISAHPTFVALTGYDEQDETEYGLADVTTGQLIAGKPGKYYLEATILFESGDVNDIDFNIHKNGTASGMGTTVRLDSTGATIYGIDPSASVGDFYTLEARIVGATSNVTFNVVEFALLYKNK